jgi:hypothetical protein
VSHGDTNWRTLEVWAYERSSIFAFDGDRRLAVLRLWRAGRRLPLVWFTRDAAEVNDRAAVDWTGFPEPDVASRLAPG